MKGNEINRKHILRFSMMTEANRLSQPPDERALFTYERRRQIAQLLEQQQRVTVPELSQHFAVSEVTIRKDLAWLEGQKLAVRTHGGAILAEAAPPLAEEGFAVREQLCTDEKERIGACAAHYVQDGETIYLDASTTALAMTPHLKGKRDLTIVTNGLRIGMELVGTPGISVLMPSGMLRAESFSLIGTWGETFLRQIHITKAFMGARGFTLAEGLTDINSGEIEMKRAVVQAAREVVAIIDHTKWEQVALATFCPSSHIHTIITDALVPPNLLDQTRTTGIKVLTTQ